MSAASRLWRRAPVWRLCLICAICTTGLAAMFPPAVPHWLGAAHSAAAISNDPSPRFVPQPASGPPAYGLEMPPAGPGRSGIIPFADRQLPLPAGDWQELVLAKSGTQMAVQVELLGRLDSNRLTGLFLAAAPGPMNNAAGAAADPAPCDEQNAIAHQTMPADLSRDPLSHECWSLLPLDMDSAASPAKTNEVLRRGLGRLQEMGVAIPSHMVVMTYMRSDPTGWLTVLLLLPERNGEQQAASRKLQAWVRRFAPLLHKGFDGTLELADLSPARVRDPD